MKSKTGNLKVPVIEFIVTAGIFMLSVFLFSFIANEMVIENEDHLDLIALNLIALYASPFNTKAAQLVSFFGSGYFLLPAYLFIIIYQIWNKKIRHAIIVGFVALVSLLSVWILKDIFHRTRPLLPLISGTGGYSFPSGHSLGGFTFSGVLIFLLWRTGIRPYLKWTLSVLLIFFALLIGLSRIYLRVHFASDVLGSLLVTVIWLSLTFFLLESLEHKSQIL